MNTIKKIVHRNNDSTTATPNPATVTLEITGTDAEAFAQDMMDCYAQRLAFKAGICNGTLEIIVCSAVKIDDLVIPSVRHYDQFVHDIAKRLGISEVRHDQQGFITNKYRFVDRVEGLALARAAGQVVREVGGSHSKLFSECMW